MKKIGSVLLAALTGLCVLLPSVGCDDSCKHNVGEWEVVTPATCGATGVQEGICGICLEKVTQTLPVDPNNHPYGEWDIVTMPQEETGGSATKTCSLNESHTLEIDLPNLADVAYDSEITVRPTVAKDGERTYRLKHEAGEVVFMQPVPAIGIQNLRDAVDLGASSESKTLIRSAEGVMGFQYFKDSNSVEPDKDLMHAHKYEFGEDYTHIVDGTDACERWYFTDESGKVYGLTDFSDGMTEEGLILNDLTGAGNKKYLDGSRLYLQYANNLGSYYGIEALLEGLYRSARWSDNDDFREWTEEENGKTSYHFFFGKVENSGNASGYFAQVEVSFTLSASFTVENLLAVATIYVNNSEQGNSAAIKTWEFDENGKAVVLQENGTRYVSKIDFTQTMKTSADEIPVNPHPLDKVYVQSFDVTYHGKVLGDGEYAEFAAGESVNTGYVFAIANVQPSEALTDYALDSFSFYLRTKNERGETVDLEIGIDTLKTVGMNAYMRSSTHEFFLRAQRAGEQTVVVKSAFFEREIHCKIAEEPPRAIYPTFYRYENGEYIWDYRDKTLVSLSSTVTHYVGQPFYFTADVPADQKNYASASYNYVIRKSSTSGAEVSADWIIGNFFDGRPVVQFTPEAKGTYVIVITSQSDPSVKSTVYLKVVDAPSFATMTDKEYTQRLSYPTFTTASVIFTDRKEVLDSANKVTGYTVTATVTLTDGTFQVLQCEYDVKENKLTSTHSSGNAELGFIIAINDAYDLVLSHSDGFGGAENVVLAEKEAA